MFFCVYKLRGITHKMKIFKQEIVDNVAALVQANASVAYCSPAMLCPQEEIVDNHLSNTIDKIKAASANPEQIDLYYLKSVLVSTGWNKNDDVFEAQATWNARNTPEDKQFNFMHNENDIIGHITGSYVVDRDGNKLDQEEAPEQFDIITEAVLYNSWTDPENRQRMQQIIAEIEEGKWFVSMECLFAGFDYSLIDESGKATILERNENSAFLTKHLRAYGGTGEYEGRKIGRSLRDISFSGKGLVSKPANPRSVILDASQASSTDVTITQNPNKEDFNMKDTEVLEQQLAEVRSELASAKEDNASLRAEIEAAASKEVAETVAKTEATIAELAEKITNLEAALAEKESEIVSLNEAAAAKDGEMKEKMEELNKMKKEKKMEARKAALLDLGFEAEEAEESIASYEDFDDATFEAIIVAMKKMDEKKKKEEEAAEEALEEVETTEATLVDASDEQDEIEATRASVAQWLENNVLNK